MTDFKARLRIPKEEMWIGCRVKSLVVGQTQFRGYGYLRIKFDNYPWLVNWSAVDAAVIPGEAPQVDELWNLRVKWASRRVLGTKWMIVPEARFHSRCEILP